MKKRILCLVLTAVLLLSLMPNVFANDEIKVYVFGQEVSFDVPPQIINDRTMVPLRAIFESMGAQVFWDETTRTVLARKGTDEVECTIGYPAMYVNGTLKWMDVSPVIVDNRTLVPARFIAEAFGYKVDWNEAERTVYISKKWIIATDIEFKPFEYTDKEGNLVGIDVDLLAAIAADQGFEYELRSIGWDTAIASCQAGYADGLLTAVTITEDRKASGWIFSDPYFDTTNCMAVATDSDITGYQDLKGKTIGVRSGTQGAYYLSYMEEYGFEIAYFEDASAMYQAVIDGEIEACVEDVAFMKHAIKEENLSLKVVEGAGIGESSYGFAIFHIENRELIEKFNAGLKNIKANGTYDAIIAKYLSK